MTQWLRTHASTVEGCGGEALGWTLVRELQPHMLQGVGLPPPKKNEGKVTRLQTLNSSNGLFVYHSPFFIFGLAGSPCCHRLSLVAASGGYSLLWFLDFSLAQLLLTGEHRLQRVWDPAVLLQGLSCLTEGGIFLDQGSNPFPTLASEFLPPPIKVSSSPGCAGFAHGSP